MTEWQVASLCSSACFDQPATIQISSVSLQAGHNVENMWIRYRSFPNSLLSSRVKINMISVSNYELDVM